MDVSIGNRLYQYRRKSGLSQEELAAKLGVSRQAVSKWERAEAAPDTDNLINLSKIYGVTLDELINTDPADSAARSSDSSDDEINTDDNSEKKNKVHIGFDGIHVDDGKDKVDISWHGGVHVNDGDTEVHVDKENVHIVENGKVNRARYIGGSCRQKACAQNAVYNNGHGRNATPGDKCD